MIYQTKDYRGDIKEFADIVIIGSGAGGAVAAYELSEAGFNVLLLEEGSYYDSTSWKNWKPHESFRRLYRDFGLTVALGKTLNDPPIPFPLGRVVGGTTVVNSGTMFRLPEKIHKKWQREHGFDISRDELEKAFDKVERMTSTQPVPEPVLGKNAEIFRRGANKLGYRNAPLRRNADNCKGCGRCVFGCPGDNKRAMHVTYIPAALEKGATVFANAKVEKILVRSGRAYGVKGKIINGESGDPLYDFEIHARIVIVSAGAIHTPLLLLENGNLANSSGWLGKNLHLHPGSRASALFEERIEGWKGVPQGLYVDQFHDEGIMLEGIFVPPSIAAPALPHVAYKNLEIMKKYPYLSAFGVMVSDTSSGVVKRGYKKGTPLIFYGFNEEDKLKMVKGIIEMARIYFAAGAKEVFLGLYPYTVVRSIDELNRIDPSKIKRKNLEMMAFHPMGTARLGRDPKQSVVDNNLETHDIENLFIMDGSVFPSCLGVNPQETIMAFSTYASWRLIDNWGRYVRNS